MKYVELRVLRAEDVRALCIEKKFYTKGDNASYTAMLNYAFDIEDREESITAEHLQHIAEDIKEHSDTVYEVPSIMWELAQRCNSYFCVGDQ